MAERKTCVFTGMFSLLAPNKPLFDTPLSLVLPPIDYQTIQPDPQEPSPSIPPLLEKSNRFSEKQAMSVTACPHTDRKHYAKNMCNNCYHILGRERLAWACPHADLKMYAKGKCHGCYLVYYHSVQKKRRY